MEADKKSISRRQSVIAQMIIIALFCIGVTVSAQDYSEGTLSQYLFPKFDSCQVKMTTGTINHAIANYNTLTGKMVFMKDNNPYNMTVTSFVDTVIIAGRKFVPVNGVFYEVLVDAPVSLYVYHKGNLEHMGAAAGYGGRSQTTAIDRISVLNTGDQFYNLKIPEEYKVKPSPVFWIGRDGQLSSFLSKRQLLKIFPDHEDELQQFIKDNRLKIDDPEDMIKLVYYCNEIMI